MNSFSARPAATEYAPYYHTYVRLIAGDPLAALRAQPQELRRLLAGLSDEQALRIARGDTTPLPGFEQDDYVPASGADARPLAGILAEYDTVRAASLSLLESFGPEQIRQQGTASGQPVSVRAMAYILAGHEAHHLHILQERYLPQLAA
jgi:hypothetical protein